MKYIVLTCLFGVACKPAPITLQSGSYPLVETAYTLKLALEDDTAQIVAPDGTTILADLALTQLPEAEWKTVKYCEHFVTGASPQGQTFRVEPDPLVIDERSIAAPLLGPTCRRSSENVAEEVTVFGSEDALQ